MATDHDAAALILRLLPVRPGKVALHKLAYGWYRYSVIQNGAPDFSATCAALPLGPVFLGLLNRPDLVGDPTAFSAEAIARCQTVLNKLGAMSGRTLAARSHKNYYEWQIMREGMHPNQVKRDGRYVEIPVSLIREKPPTKLETNIVKAVSSEPKWMPAIAETSGVSLIKTRNAVARMFDQGVIDISRQGFVLAK